MKPKAKKLYKTTVVIWTKYRTNNGELDDLGRAAKSGDAYCSAFKCEEVTDRKKYPTTEFFDELDAYERYYKSLERQKKRDAKKEAAEEQAENTFRV